MAVIKPIQLADSAATPAELLARPEEPASGRTAEDLYPSTADAGAVAAIVGAYHSTPFDILGIHRLTVDGKPAIVIRTFQPQALTVGETIVKERTS